MSKKKEMISAGISQKQFLEAVGEIKAYKTHDALRKPEINEVAFKRTKASRPFFLKYAIGLGTIGVGAAVIATPLVLLDLKKSASKNPWLTDERVAVLSKYTTEINGDVFLNRENKSSLISDLKYKLEAAKVLETITVIDRLEPQVIVDVKQTQILSTIKDMLANDATLTSEERHKQEEQIKQAITTIFANSQTSSALSANLLQFMNNDANVKAIADGVLTSAKTNAVRDIKKILSQAQLKDAITSSAFSREIEDTISAVTTMKDLVVAKASLIAKILVSAKGEAVDAFKATATSNKEFAALPQADKDPIIAKCLAIINLAQDIDSLSVKVNEANSLITISNADAAIKAFTTSVQGTGISSATKNALIKEATDNFRGATNVGQIISELLSAQSKLLVEVQKYEIAIFTAKVQATILSKNAQDDLIAEVTKAISALVDLLEVKNAVAAADLELGNALLNVGKINVIARFKNYVHGSQLSADEQKQIIDSFMTDMEYSVQPEEFNQVFDTHLSQLLPKIKKAEIDAFAAKVHASSLLAASQMPFINDFTNAVNSATTIEEMRIKTQEVVDRFNKVNLNALADQKNDAITKFTNDIRAAHLLIAIENKLIADITGLINQAKNVTELQAKITESNTKVQDAIAQKNAFEARKTQAIAAFAGAVGGTSLADDVKAKLIHDATIAITTASDDHAVTSANANAISALLVEVKAKAIISASAIISATSLTADQKINLIEDVKRAIGAATDLREVGVALTNNDKAIASLTGTPTATGTH